MADPILPLVDRPAPLLDRVRNGSRTGDIFEKLGKEIAMLQTLSGEEEEQAVESIKSSLKTGVANHLDVDREEVDDEVVEDIADSFRGVNLVGEHGEVLNMDSRDGGLDIEVTEEEESDEGSSISTTVDEGE